MPFYSAVRKKEFNCDTVLEISVDVKNTGEVSGKESVLLYTSDMYASSTPDIRRLRNFTKIDLAFVNYHGKWALEEGDFIITVGHLNETIHCTATQVWDEPDID